ncbi:MAG: DUF1223 domain-containing protein [Acidobacteriota bacterium]
MKLRITLFLTMCAMLLMGFSLVRHYTKVRAEAEFNRDLAMLKETVAVADGKRVPVLVELFTSEGCSSCPPADALLMQLDQLQPIAGAEVIALSQHVDYWNYIGWNDPYSSPFFSRRQEAYSLSFGGDRVYTPQMIVDGQREFVGSRVAQARDEIARAAGQSKATVNIALLASNPKDAQLEITIENLPPRTSTDTTEILLAIAENNLSSSVSRGENSGRKLAHTAVVRQMKVIGKLNANEKSFSFNHTIAIEKNWKRDNLKVVAFIQERDSRKVLGAASIKL